MTVSSVSNSTLTPTGILIIIVYGIIHKSLVNRMLLKFMTFFSRPIAVVYDCLKQYFLKKSKEICVKQAKEVLIEVE